MEHRKILDDRDVLEVPYIGDFDFDEAHLQLHRCRVRFLGINAVLLDRFGDFLAWHQFHVGQRL